MQTQFDCGLKTSFINEVNKIKIHLCDEMVGQTQLAHNNLIEKLITIRIKHKTKKKKEGNL